MRAKIEVDATKEVSSYDLSNVSTVLQTINEVSSFSNYKCFATLLSVITGYRKSVTRKCSRIKWIMYE